MVQLALESTVISHGLAYPENLKTARLLEAVAREHGVEPRTIAVLNGRIKVGLSDAELEQMATEPDVSKLSRRDIAYALAKKKSGSTTVSATMFLAHRAGIRVFATGGIGGVHRSARDEPMWDVSADLIELASTPVAVVCAGAKAILNLAATLEYLETHSVPVLGYQTDEFPAFYSRKSGLPVKSTVDSAAEAAVVIRTHWELGNTSGVLVCVPVPVEQEIPRSEIEPFIESALRDADSSKITGNAVTPFLLKRLAEITEQKSVQTNIALLKNNVAVGSDIAKELDSLNRRSTERWV